MKILVIGSGGREHALCWKIASSPLCEKLYCAPGNGGIEDTAECVDICADDISGLLAFARDQHIGLTVVGPEGPLVGGLVDRFHENGLRVFGPSKGLAMIEGSKVFAKELMRRFSVPTADFKVFSDGEEALAYLDTRRTPLVVKADGLCAGKGVVVTRSISEAKTAVRNMMIDRVFGEAGSRVIIEDCLAGEEASIIVISDGEHIVPLASSQDHKRAFDGDRGPNTGGMGAYSPAPVITDQLFQKIVDTVISPMIRGLASQGTPYKGALYAGIMVTPNGPMVLEFNARFGDPETQAILPRLKGDLVEVMNRSIDGALDGYRLEWDPRPCVSVVMASGGYPGSYEKGKEVKGINDAKRLNDVVVFHAGTKRGRRATNGSGLILTVGGRVLNVTALGETIPSAIDACYAAVGRIQFEKMHFRKDIGYRARGAGGR